MKSTSWTRLFGRRRLSFAIVLALFLASGLTFSQNPPPNAPKTIDIITYLKETINWYRGTVAEEQIANEPTDLTFLNENRRISGQIVRLAFDFARLVEQNESKRPAASQTPDQTNAPSPHERLILAVASAEQQVEQSQNELQSLRQKLETTPEKKRQAIESLIGETESELAFRKARRDALRNILQFATETSTNESGAAGLHAKIEELARSVPAALSGSESASSEQGAVEQTSTAKSSAKKKEQPSTIWGLASELLQLSRKGHTLDQQVQSTDRLVQYAKQFRAPLVANLRSLIQSGDQLASQSPSGDPSSLAVQKKQLDALTVQFKQASAGLLPLSKQRILLDLYKRTLTNWRETVRSEFNDELRKFLVRLGILVLIIAVVFIAAEAWRRAIFRYIREARRRYQLLLLRKIILWIAIGVIVAFTFAPEFRSVATFAGLLTAGVAVGLQNVILSVAGYFFLMGKYGIRVGDRVQIAGVTGEVVDIGLVRIHLLELSSGGMDPQPSGRVVAFSNSVVFQPTSGVFKKIPGITFVWHEISLTFSPESNYRLIQERIANAVDIALKDHREEMERQMRHMEQTLNSISAIELRPKTHLRSTASGIEVTVSFPVELRHAVDIDDRMLRELNAAIEQEPKLKLAGSGMPTLRTDITTSTGA